MSVALLPIWNFALTSLNIAEMQREWAEAKKELHEEREKREIGMNNALKQIEEMRKELTSALCAVAAAEARASLAEVDYFDFSTLTLAHIPAEGLEFYF